MKKNRSFAIFLSIVVILLSVSCTKEAPAVGVDPDDMTINQYVNHWILEEMGTYYLWNNKIPSRLDDTIDPESYFDSMLYKYDQYLRPDGDRFSWIQDNYLELLEQLSGVASNEPGFEYKWYGYNDNDVFGEIAYVKKETEAQALGLKRGQVFTHVNNIKLTTSNYQTVMSEAKQNPSITLKVFDALLDLDASELYFDNEQNLTIKTLSRYAENPIHLDTVYSVKGKTIGYLVYNFFAPDSGDETGSYDLDLNNAIAKFTDNGVDNLILDLRYNSGGRVSSAIYLSSMIVRGLDINNIFCQMEYNKGYNDWIIERYGADYLKDPFTNTITVYDKEGNEKREHNLNNIGNLQNLIILTGNWTASASEMVINGLKPYMDLYLAGNVTIGKNVASSTFYVENDSKNKWGMQPIIAKYYNSQGKSDFTSGFTPDYLDPDTWNMPKKELGDIDEALLDIAIRQITGEALPAPQTRSLHLAPSFMREMGSSLDHKAWSNQIIARKR